MSHKMMNYKVFILFLAMILTSCTSCSNKETGSSDDGRQTAGDGYTEDVEYYRFSPRLTESTVYAVKAAGEYIKVFPTDEPHLAWIGVDEGTVKFEISLQSEKIESAVVRPLGKNYSYEIAHGRLVLGLKKYDRVSVELNGDIEHPLFIFVNPKSSEKPSEDDPSVKYFAAGQIYDEGDIRLTEECREIYLEPGTYVKGNILGVDIDGVKIHGGGLLDSSLYTGRYPEKFYQPFGIALYGCENSRVEDLTSIFASGGWCSLYSNCHNSCITNVKTLGLNSAPGVKTNNDSMDIIGGVNVHVSKCFLRGHDDAYCLKSQKFKIKGDGVDGIWYEDCIGWNVDAGNAFEIGYETQLDIKNVHYKDVYAIHSGTSGTDYRRSAFGIHNGAAGTISDVTYENAYVEDAMEFAVYLACLEHGYNIGYEDDGTTPLKYSPGKITDVKFNNLQVLNVRPGKGYCVIRGYDGEHGVSDVTFDGFSYLGRAVTSLEDPIWIEKTNCADISFTQQ